MRKFKISVYSIGFVFLISLSGCKWGDDEKTIWVYTSLFKDTVVALEPELKKDFPGYEFKFYQAGSEEVAGKVYAESLAGRIQADVLISSDRFWYEDMAGQGKLLKYLPKNAEKVDANFRHPEHFYSTLSHPVMVLAYNNEVINAAEAPQTFKELTETKWSKKVSSGSPLASGTSFTTVAFLINAYGWEYFKSLRANDFIAEGGNSGVIRRMQNKERPVGIVLMENILRLVKTDKRIQMIIPKDGAIIQSNVLAIVKKPETEKTKILMAFADWMFGEKGQKAMAESFMYPSVPGHTQPENAPPFAELLKTAKPWTADFIQKTLKEREFIKEEFSQIVY